MESLSAGLLEKGWRQQLSSLLHVSEKGIKYFLTALLVAMSFAICYQVIWRYFFNSPSSITEEFLRYSLIWLGVLGAGYGFIHDKHLNLPLIFEKLSQNGSDNLNIFNAIIKLIFGAILIWGGYFAIVENSKMLSPMMKIPVGQLQGVLLLAGSIVVVSQLIALGKLIRSDSRKIRVALVISFVLAAMTYGVSLFKETALFEYLLFEQLEIFSLIVLFGTFFAFLILGTPIAIGLAFAGIFTLSIQIDADVLFSTSGERIFNSLDSFGFLALPFFILAGNIMNQGGIARRLIALAMLLGKRIPGNLWQANVIGNMLFGSLSGSAIAASTAIGGIISPIAKEKNYDMAITTAVNAASSPSGMLIPPTGTFIVYSLITGGSASIISLFVAGYVPGIIMGLCVMAVALYYAKKLNYPVDRTPYVWSEVGTTMFRAVPSLLLVVLVIGGIVGGIFTAIEGSGIAVLYSLALALCYKNLTVEKLGKILSDTAITSGTILFLIGCSGLMSWSMTFASIPDTIGAILTSISDNKYVILLMINIALLIVGVFMDMAPAQLIFTPILYPVVTALGVDPVHFGVIMIYNLCMGIVTPPVGTVLFVSCGISGESIPKVVKPLLPIFVMQFIGLLLITYFPAVSLTLPRLMGL